MASVNFLYRSTRDKGCLVLRLLYRFENKDHVLGAKTKIKVSQNYWKNQHNSKRTRDIDVINIKGKVNAELLDLKNHVLSAFNVNDPEAVDKNWLKNIISDFYNPPSAIEKLPNGLIDYIDRYIELKENEVAKSTIKKCNVIKHLIERFEQNSNKKLLISDVDTSFKLEFEKYCIKHNYATNTIARALRFIKTVSKHAHSNGIETSYQLDNIKIKYQKSSFIYLTFDDLEKIENSRDLPEYLANAKDWLIISCYLGQRVSDFMYFKKEMIKYEKNNDNIIKPFIDFTQKKTGKIMSIPIHLKVIEILNKRGGNFPREISDQKYNDYIKKVCKLAGLTDIVKGTKKQELSPNSKIYRNESKMYEKWELVTSHIGRRSFASNFNGKIPRTYLTYMTGHSTEKSFLNYIGKSNNDLGLELSAYF
ncbi:MAG: phage integrase SAM-like domain-containing protein [Eudoraea sp.]|uniref:phage integrase SAM-like domain-containing protein n=1 Tax=Eudoraea sp. TaxID=1979955 RepID=UPI003263CAAC